MSFFSGQTDKQKAQSVKKVIDVEGAHRRRLEEQISLRKKNRDRELKARRLEGTEVAVQPGQDGQPRAGTLVPSSSAAAGDAGPPVSMLNPGPLDPFYYNSKSDPHTVPVALLPTFAQFVLDPASSLELQLHGTMCIRKLLAVDVDPPIDEIIGIPGLTERLVFFLQADICPGLQFEAAWSLTNIASGRPEHTHHVLSKSAVPGFIRLLASPNDEVKEQTTWALGNLAGESPECRDYIIACGVLQPLCECIANNVAGKLTVVRNAVWAMSNLCRAKPQPDLAVLQPTLPLLASLLTHHDDEVVVDAAWALSFISDGPQERIQAVLNQAIVPRIVQLLSSASAAVITPAIRIIGNIAAGNDVQTQIVVNGGALACFPHLLTHVKRTIRKEACWTCSNITAGNADQIGALIQARLIPLIIRNMSASEFEVKKEAVWTIANATSGGTREQIKYLVEAKVLEALCDVLGCFDARLIVVALEALENILAVGEEERLARNLQRNPVVVLLHHNNGLSKIETLQQHATSDVYNHVMAILEQFFDIEEAPGAITASAATPAATAPVAATPSGHFVYQAPTQPGAWHIGGN